MCSSSFLTGEKEVNLGSREAGDNGPTRSSANESREIPHHADFGDSANDLWSLYVKEAESHDEATSETVKENMDGALIFVGLYSSTRLRA